MDITDKKILKILAENSNASATEIGNAVNLSVPAVNKRIARLSNDGIIKSYTVVTDETKTGKPIIAFIFAVFNYNEGSNTLLNYVKSDRDILECYSVTGEYDENFKKNIAVVFHYICGCYRYSNKKRIR